MSQVALAAANERQRELYAAAQVLGRLLPLIAACCGLLRLIAACCGLLRRLEVLRCSPPRAIASSAHDRRVIAVIVIF